MSSIIVLWLCKMFFLREAGWRVYWKSVLDLQLFCKSKTILYLKKRKLEFSKIFFFINSNKTRWRILKYDNTVYEVHLLSDLWLIPWPLSHSSGCQLEWQKLFSKRPREGLHTLLGLLHMQGASLLSHHFKADLHTLNFGDKDKSG